MAIEEQTTDWTPWECELPPDGEVEWRRRGWDAPCFVAAWRSFHPEFNVAGLEWRPLAPQLTVREWLNAHI